MNACKNKIGIKITRFMGQRRRFFLLLEHVSESNGSIHSQDAVIRPVRKLSEYLVVGMVVGKSSGLLFFFSLLLLQSRLKQCF